MHSEKNRNFKWKFLENVYKKYSIRQKSVYFAFNELVKFKQQKFFVFLLFDLYV